MLSLLRSTLIVLWSLWFGGVCALLLFVTRLFANSHDVGVIAAPVLFHAFAAYALIVGAIATITSLVIFTRATRPADRYALLFFVIALLGAVGAKIVTDKIENMQATGQVQTPEFKRMHGVSGTVYLTETIALLLAGIASTISRGPGALAEHSGGGFPITRKRVDDSRAQDLNTLNI